MIPYTGRYRSITNKRQKLQKEEKLPSALGPPAAELPAEAQPHERLHLGPLVRPLDEHTLPTPQIVVQHHEQPQAQGDHVEHPVKPRLRQKSERDKNSEYAPVRPDDALGELRKRLASLLGLHVTRLVERLVVARQRRVVLWRQAVAELVPDAQQRPVPHQHTDQTPASFVA